MRVIGIGAGEDAAKVFSSIGEWCSSSRVIVYTTPRKDPDFPSGSTGIRESPDPGAALADDLAAGRIDAAIRGTLPANTTLAALKRVFTVDHLERAALLETPEGRRFLLTPVGIDEGWTVGGKVTLAEKAVCLAGKLGLSPGVGVLSGGRLGDVGRDPVVDRTLADAELVARLTGGMHYGILIEDAIRECGVIIAQDGVCGNLIFRTLTLLGSGQGHGAPVLNISKIFVDTSRATPRYENAIRLAENLLK